MLLACWARGHAAGSGGFCHAVSPAGATWWWGLSSIPLPPAAVAQEPISTAGKCNTIYKGFAGCLISLGDSMAQSVRQQRDEEEEEGGQEAQELDTICR